MLKDKFKSIRTAQDKKEVDLNGFWYLYDNPITKVGIFPYLGRQISPELEPETIYQVLRPKEELTRPETLKSFKNKPLINDHEMLGKEIGTTPAEKRGIHGNLGENVKFDDATETVTNNIAVYSETMKNDIESGKTELSLGYKCRYELTPGEYKGRHYDAVQRDIFLNHIALVSEGRMGHDVRIMDSACACDSFSEVLIIQKKEKNQMTVKTKLNSKTIKKTAMDEDVDKRELLREVDAIAMKPASEFKGGEEEKFRTITKKLEEIAYNKSEAGTANDEDLDKRKDIDEIGGMLKGKVDEELWRTIIGKVEKVAYNPSESGGNDEDPTDPKEGKDDDEEVIVEGAPAEGAEALKEEIKEEIKEELKEAIENIDTEAAMDSMVKMLAKRDELVSRVRPLIGDNVNYSSMTHSQVIKYACDKLDLAPSKDALEGYLKANSQHSSLRFSLDSAISTGKSNVIKEYLKK